MDCATYNDASFSREYESQWSGDAENAYFSAEKFDANRELLQPEYEYSNRSSKEAYYVIGVDVGRKGCQTEAVIIKCTPKGQNVSTKTIVNLYSYKDMHFEEQAVELKKLYFKYRARVLALDGNGLGIGLLDYMVKDQIDKETGDLVPNFGIENDDEGFYKKYKTGDTVPNAIHIIKANAPINTEMHAYLQTQLHGNKIKFLIDENQAKVKLLQTKQG